MGKIDKTYKTKVSYDLIIPIYLDTSALLDILASIEDGFTIVEKVSTRSSTAGTVESSVGTEFGIHNILSLLKISIGASRSKTKAEEGGEERQLDRYHTYGSLLYKLRSDLLQMGLLKSTDKSSEVWRDVKPSDFVEFRGRFRPLSLLESLATMGKILDLVQLFSKPQMLAPKDPKTDKKRVRDKIKQFEQIKEILKGMISDLEQEDIRTFVVESTDSSGYKAVVSLFIEYLRDRSLTEISNREFRSIGKVVRSISKQNEVIDLLRGTALGGLSDEILTQFTEIFSRAEGHGLRLPQIETKIKAPALEVVPIAIYV